MSDDENMTDDVEGHKKNLRLATDEQGDDVEGHKMNLRHAIDDEGDDVEGHKMNLRHAIDEEPAPGFSGALGAGDGPEGRGSR